MKIIVVANQKMPYRILLWSNSSASISAKWFFCQMCEKLSLDERQTEKVILVRLCLSSTVNSSSRLAFLTTCNFFNRQPSCVRAFANWRSWSSWALRTTDLRICRPTWTSVHPSKPSSWPGTTSKRFRNSLRVWSTWICLTCPTIKSTAFRKICTACKLSN